MLEERLLPLGKVVRVREKLIQPKRDDNSIEKQVGTDKRDRYSDCLFETTQENHSQNCDQRQRHPYLVLEYFRRERVLNNVGSRISRRESDCNNKVSGNESKQDKNK